MNSKTLLTLLLLPPWSKQFVVNASGSLDAQALPEWTVLVFMNADNNLEEFGIKDFLEMSSVGSTDQVNMIVQMDRCRGFSARFGDWTETYRFKVEKGMKPLPARALEKIGEVNMGDPQVLRAFIDWGKAKFPAKKYVS